MPSFHWWRTVFFLIPAIGTYTIVLGAVSVASSLVDRTGRFAHACARLWSRLILVTTGVRVRVEGIMTERLPFLEAEMIYDLVVPVPLSPAPAARQGI